MILPGYMNPKTVCVQCWRNIVFAQEESWNRISELGEEREIERLTKDFTVLATKATAFLARGGFFYSWEMIRQHVMNGYRVYQDVTRFPVHSRLDYEGRGSGREAVHMRSVLVPLGARHRKGLPLPERHHLPGGQGLSHVCCHQPTRVLPCAAA